MFGFGKNKDKKKKPIVVGAMHYNGLDMPVDYPCQITVDEEMMTITHSNPETTITLPLTQIKAFSSLEEARYMLKYQGQRAITDDSIEKYYLVVDYTSKDGEDKQLVFWGTVFQAIKYDSLEFMELPNKNRNYSL